MYLGKADPLNKLIFIPLSYLPMHSLEPDRSFFMTKSICFNKFYIWRLVIIVLLHLCFPEDCDFFDTNNFAYGLCIP